MFHKLIYLVGSKLRNPMLSTHYKNLKKSERYSINELKELQNERFLNLFRWAINNSPFYKNFYNQYGINESSISSMDDIEKLPIIDKKILLENSKDIHSTNLKGRKIYSETSGSTGEPLIFYRNLDWDSSTRAAQLRGYSWYNVKPWEKNGYFWGFNFSFIQKLKIRFLDFLLNRYRLFSYEDKKIEKFIKKSSRMKYIEGYSSMIHEISLRLKEKNIKLNKIKMVKGTSEKIYDSYQDDAKYVFDKKIISEYGSAESGIIAFECPYGNMHIAMENVIVEVINNEIVVTNLWSYSFPIIRYNLGDYVEISNNTICSCGMNHTIIKSILGRVGGLIEGYKHKYPSLTLYYVFKNIASNQNLVINYQVIQNKVGEIDLYLSRDPSTLELGIILKEFEKYFNSDVIVNYKGIINLNDRKSKYIDYINNIKKELP